MTHRQAAVEAEYQKRMQERASAIPLQVRTRRSGPPPPQPIQTRTVSNSIPETGGITPQNSVSVTKRATKARKAQPPQESIEDGRLSDEQRSKIQRYIILDNEVSELNSLLKAKRAARKEVEEEILALVKIQPVRSGANVLRAKKKTVKEGLNQKFWIKKLVESGELRDPNTAPNLVKNIYKNRSGTEDYALVVERNE